MSLIKQFLHQFIRNFQPMRYIDPARREDLISAYCNETIDNMDLETLQQFAYDFMLESMETLSDDHVIKEIETLHCDGDKKEAFNYVRSYITDDEAMVYFGDVNNIHEGNANDWQDFWENEEKATVSNLNTKDGITTPW